MNIHIGSNPISTFFLLLAQWQSSNLLSYWSWVRLPYSVAGITQRLECLPVAQEVIGSNPIIRVFALGGMVYTADLKSVPFYRLWVQVPQCVAFFTFFFITFFFFLFLLIFNSLIYILFLLIFFFIMFFLSYNEYIYYFVITQNLYMFSYVVCVFFTNLNTVGGNVFCFIFSVSDLMVYYIFIITVFYF